VCKCVFDIVTTYSDYHTTSLSFVETQELQQQCAKNTKPTPTPKYIALRML
jgi:hypothetical protein